LLLGLGIDEISASPIILPKIKKTIRSVNSKWAQEIARRSLQFRTGVEVYAYVTEQLQEVARDLVEE